MGDAARKDDATAGDDHNFPSRLQALLDHLEVRGDNSVASWQPHGRCFAVSDRERFVKELLPVHFKQTKFSSFQRQLNLYGFARLTTGPDKGAYWHAKFLRGHPSLCNGIRRIKVKGTGTRKASEPEAEPNFYLMPPLTALGSGDSAGERTDCKKDHTETESAARQTIFPTEPMDSLSLSVLSDANQAHALSPQLWLQAQQQVAQPSLSSHRQPYIGGILSALAGSQLNATAPPSPHRVAMNPITALDRAGIIALGQHLGLSSTPSSLSSDLLHRLAIQQQGQQSEQGLPLQGLSVSDYLRLQQLSRSFSSNSLRNTSLANFQGLGGPDRFLSQSLATSYFRSS